MPPSHPPIFLATGQAVSPLQLHNSQVVALGQKLSLHLFFSCKSRQKLSAAPGAVQAHEIFKGLSF